MSTPQFQIKSLLLLVLLLFSGRTFGQPMLGSDASPETVVFELTNKDALKLLKGKLGRKDWDRIQQTPFTRFTKTWTDLPAKGHFLLADIERNEVHYRYAPVIPFHVFLFKEYGVLTLQVVDAEGTIRKDAKVRVGGRAVYYDKDSQTYTDDNWSQKEQHILTVELDKFRAVFDLRKHLVSPWYRNDYGQQSGPEFYSYLITDKNKYKPGETVRFKSYALSERKRPLKQELSLWMRTGSSWRDYKKIMPVTPYHPGGYAGEFQLDDSLNLKLDQMYVMQLRDKRGRIVGSTGFRYEDYELNGNKLLVKLASNVQYAPQSNRIDISATDANGLPLREVNVEVTINRQQVLKSYTEILSLPDTLMSVQAELDASGKASVDIPSKIFGASDCFYSVNAVLLTADNNRLEQYDKATFYHCNHDIQYTTQADTIIFSFFDLGVERPVAAELVYGDKKEVKKIRLPYREPFNQSVSDYRFKIPEADYETVITADRLDSGLKLNGGIEKDSFCVSLSNPLQLELSWYVYQGNRLLQKGSGKKMEHRSGEVDPSSVYYVEIFYFMGDKECMLKRSYTSPSERLLIESDLPERVYPGQKITTKLNVTNIQGHPVANVDLTAFAVNSQLNYYVPDLPYYGSAPRPREQRASYSMQQKEYLHTGKLDYKRWNQLLHLERLPYYQFAYPSGKLFRQTADTPDGTTQFAPYVMLNGEAVNIYVIEQNDVPCYFSWTEQPKEYSFPVLHPSAKQKITLRMHDRAFIIDSLAFERGKKTILSFDMNRLPQGVSMVWLRQKKGKSYDYKFTPEERKRYERYLCRLPVAEGWGYTSLEHKGNLFPVSLQGLPRYKKNILAGPVEPGLWKYMNGVLYRHEGGFSYEFEGNVVYKYKDDELCPRRLYFSSVAKIPTLDDFHLSPERFRKLVEEHKKGISWHPSRIYFSLPDKKLNFRLPEEKDSTGVANLFFRDCATGEMHYPDTLVRKSRIYSKLPAGIYDAILLYRNGKYLKRDSLRISPYTYMDVNMESLSLHECDSLSAKWLLSGGEAGFIGTNTSFGKTMRITQYVRHYGGKICGYVVDSTGEGLIGCSVLVKGTMEGTITNVDGYFEMDCDRSGDLLQISYIGFKSQEIMATPGMNLMITLEEDSQALEEVVVVGYGISARRSLTGAVVGFSADSSTPASAPLEKLEEQDKETKDEVDAGQIYNELMQLSGLRRNFSDVAFWQPRLLTDKTGTVRFETTFPDNMTKWEVVVYAMNRRLQTGTFRRSVRSYKPLMAELKTPRFLIDGDQSALVGTIRNYLEGQQIKGNVQFCVDGDARMEREVNLTQGFHETLPMQVANTDSVTMSYLFTRDDGYKDGEEYTIPVLPQGTELAEGTLSILSDTKTVKVQSGKNEEVTVSIMDNQLDVYKESVNYLNGYKYLCNEQLASKLIGLLAYQKLMQNKGKPGETDKAIKSIVRKLVNNQNKQKLWSWWGNMENTSYWMSAHILRALKLAKDAGYTVDLNLNGLEINYAHVRPYRGMKLDDIEILHALYEWGVRADYSSAVKLLQPFVRQQEQKEDSLANRYKDYRPRSYLKEKLLLWEIKQQVDSVNIADSVNHYLKKDILGSVYCDDGRRTSSWSQEGNKMINTLIAYRIIKNDSSLYKLKDKMQLYILRTKERGWNTYQASSAVATILTDILKESKGTTGTTVSVSGKDNKRITEFPYQARLTAGESLLISKTGKEPLLYSVYSTKCVMDARESDSFKVESTLETDSLVAGMPVTLTVTLQVKQEGAQYVMLEVPIPAGCSYASKPVNFSGGEVYREYFKEKTVIFSEKLPIGTYRFTIPLLPRFTGKYTLNPAKVELMYFPVVNANNEGKRIWITERKTKE